MANEAKKVAQDETVYEADQVTTTGIVKSTKKFNDLMVSYENLEDVPEEERFDMFLRKSQAESSDKIDSYVGKKLVATKITPYTKDYVDMETGEAKTAIYVSFELENGDSFKASGIRAVPFAKDMALFVGVDTRTGELKHKVEFEIKVEQGKNPITGQPANIHAYKALRIIKK